MSLLVKLLIHKIIEKTSLHC